MSSRKKLLVVDDDQVLAKGIGIRLASEFDLVFAEDGISTLSRARSCRPDVILLDLGLPAGDGLQVLEWLRENIDLANIPVIVLTGRDDRGLEARVLDLGAVAFFTKPADHRELVEVIRHLATQPQPRRRRLLVVDDDPDIRDSMTARLRAEDYDVVCAQDGATALVAAHQHSPDLVLLDLGLPAGDGYSVLSRMRNIDQFARTPVIVLSGRDKASNRAKSLEGGAAAYLEKPVETQELVDLVEALL